MHLFYFRGLDPNRGYTPDPLSSPEQQQILSPGGGIQMQLPPRGPNLGPQSSATPTMQQRIKAMGVATPLALSSPVRR